MNYFLLVYDRSRGVLVSCEQFAESQRREALRRRFALEDDFRARPEYEIVVLGGSSLKHIKQTHGRYFKSVGELAST